jgi:hypothetical protein
MARSSDPVTRRVRDAANAAAVAVIAYGGLFFVTSQVAAVRAVSPFGEDPADLASSFAALFLPLVVGATWVRSLAHRGPRLELRVARRITIGSGLAVAIVAAAVAADILAMLATPGWTDAAGPLALVIIGSVAATAVLTLGAAALLGNAAAAVVLPATPDEPPATEPDIVDDALALVVEAGALVRLGRSTRLAAYAVEQFLDRSPISPRRHRLIFGAALAVAGAIAFVAWHAFREGPWASPAAALVFGSLPAIGILAIYLVTLAPLRLLRPPA